MATVLVLLCDIACGRTEPRLAPTASPSLSPEETSPLTPISSPAVGPETIVYVVEPGDTLGSIAIKFGTTVEAIVAANSIKDPDFIKEGQELIIPLR